MILGDTEQDEANNSTVGPNIFENRTALDVLISGKERIVTSDHGCDIDVNWQANFMFLRARFSITSFMKITMLNFRLMSAVPRPESLSISRQRPLYWEEVEPERQPAWCTNYSVDTWQVHKTLGPRIVFARSVKSVTK